MRALRHLYLEKYHNQAHNILLYILVPLSGYQKILILPHDKVLPLRRHINKSFLWAKMTQDKEHG